MSVFLYLLFYSALAVSNATCAEYASTTWHVSAQNKQPHYYHCATRGLEPWRTTGNTGPNLLVMNQHQLMRYFIIHHYSQDQILSNPLLYKQCAYLAIARQLPKFPEYVAKYYHKYRNYSSWDKFIGCLASTYSPKLSKKFAQLYAECEQETTRKKELRRYETEKQQIRAQKQVEDNSTYLQHLERVERILRDGQYIKTPKANHTARIDALNACKHNTHHTQHVIKVDQDAVSFIHTYGITEPQITEVNLNRYEHQLHTEFMGHIKSALGLKNKYNIHDQNVFIDALGNGIILGIRSNQLHNPEWATRWADFGHEAVEILRGMGDGIVLGSYNTVDMVLHPVRTLVRMVDGVRMLGSLTVRTLGTLAHLNSLIEQGEYLECATEICTVGEQLCSLAMSLKEHTAQMSNREIAKHASAFGTEWVLTGQMFAIGHTLCSSLGNTVKKTIKFFKDEGVAGEFALATTHGVLLKASENMQKGGSGIKNLINNTSELLEIAIAEYTAGLKAELEIVRKTLDNRIKGFFECANKYLKPEYEHILGINPISGRNGISKIGGFHHDVMHSFRKSGILEFVDLAKTESGFYKADIFAAGRYVDTKTFFPAHWSRKQVMEKILETCESFIKSGLQPTLTKDGKYLIKHMIENGVEIEIYITKSGHIKTAYPVLK